MKTYGWLIIAAGIVFYLGIDRIVKAVEGVVNPKEKKPEVDRNR